MRSIIGCMFIFLCGCSGLERSEQEKIRKVNAKAEIILRQEDEEFCPLEVPQQRIREPYSWEEKEVKTSARE